MRLLIDNSFPAISLGNNNVMKVGQKIYAIGSPLGFENTMTEGIISGLRDRKGEKFIQISTPISPGSSGGAVVNSKGELIGITTSSITEGQNLNFAIPVNEVIKVYKQIGINQKEIDAAIYFYKGISEYDKKNYDTAIADFKNVLTIMPESEQAYLYLGIIYDIKKDYQTAINYYKQALSINSQFDKAYFNLGSQPLKTQI